MKKFLVLFFIVVFKVVVIFIILMSYYTNVIAVEMNIPDEYSTIQEAIDVARDGDVIVVHPGIYYENINFLTKAITIRSLDPEDPNIVTVTVIDGNRTDSVVTFHGKEGPNSVLSGVTVQNGVAEEGGGISCRFSSPSIINCTIIENETDPSRSELSGEPSSDGGGICCYKSSPTIDNCIIIRNSSQGGGSGGGICCKFSSPDISNCIINMNSSGMRGGGIFCHESSPNITNCIISENSVYERGGGIWCFNSSPNINNCNINNHEGDGIYCTSSSPFINECLIAGNGNGGICCQGFSLPRSHFTISNCIITGNSAPWYGGGIYCDSTSPHITKCIISENYAPVGGGIHCLSSSPAIGDCVITENSAQEGGGISCVGRSAPDITNCIIAGNEASRGGGVSCQGHTQIMFIHRSEISLPSPHITNCTIVKNKASVSGGGIFSDLNVFISLMYKFSVSGGGIFRFISEPTITNCILWENYPDQVLGRRLKIVYSDVQDGEYFGRGNIDNDPLFVDPNAGDYHLNPDSPCIHTGRNRCDMGAYGTYEDRMPWRRSGRYQRR